MIKKGVFFRNRLQREFFVAFAQEVVGKFENRFAVYKQLPRSGARSVQAKHPLAKEIQKLDSCRPEPVFLVAQSQLAAVAPAEGEDRAAR